MPIYLHLKKKGEKKEGKKTERRSVIFCVLEADSQISKILH